MQRCERIVAAPPGDDRAENLDDNKRATWRGRKRLSVGTRMTCSAIRAIGATMLSVIATTEMPGPPVYSASSSTPAHREVRSRSAARLDVPPSRGIRPGTGDAVDKDRTIADERENVVMCQRRSGSNAGRGNKLGAPFANRAAVIYRVRRLRSSEDHRLLGRKTGMTAKHREGEHPSVLDAASQAIPS